jgi:apolipoprotein N-acyltransferase
MRIFGNQGMKMKPEMSKRDAILIVSSAAIGYLGFTTTPRAAALVLAVPVFWALAGSRYAAFAVVFACKLAASRGLLPGAAVFLSEYHTFTEAAALYFLMPFGASLPFGMFWSDDRRRKAICLVLAFFTAYVLPPISLIGIINPLMASGMIFRGWGFAGMLVVLGIYALCAVSRKTAFVFLCVIGIFAFLPPDSWYEPPKPEGIAAIDTSFGRLGSGSFNFERDYERAHMVFSELGNRIGKDASPDVVILPETIAGRLNDTGLELWKRGLEKLFGNETAVIFGAELPAGNGKKYDNALLMLYDGKITASLQRIPVIYSMYRGPFAKSGANLHLLDSGILELPDGRKAAVIVCYEAFLTWPFLVSMFHKPDMIICMANLWWCRETSLPATQRNVVSLWALTFGIPAAFVWNI